jgi:hypothetical protein
MMVEKRIVLQRTLPHESLIKPERMTENDYVYLTAIDCSLSNQKAPKFTPQSKHMD